MKIQEARARARAMVPEVVTDVPCAAAVRLATALDEVENACERMNKGTPRWMLVDTIMAIINGERDA